MSDKKHKTSVLKLSPEEKQSLIEKYLTKDDKESYDNLLVKFEKGATYIDKDGDYFLVDDIRVVRKLDERASCQAFESARGSWPKSIEEVDEEFLVYEDEIIFDIYREDDNGGLTEKIKDLRIHDMNYHHGLKYCARVYDMASSQRLAQDITEGKAHLPDFSKEESGEDETGTGLVYSGSSKHLSILRDTIAQRSNEIQCLNNHIRRIFEIQQSRLKSMMFKMEEVVAVMHEKVRRIQRFIHTIELYLGVNESIIQIQEGEKASVDEPISFRQRVMYMDEEVGDPYVDKSGLGEGLSFEEIEDFDDWLCKNDNYKKVIPEAKCVCVFKPRRNSKASYALVNPYVKAMLDQADKKTYILIRNGDNLYRIWVDLEVKDRLFPMRDEIMKLQEEASKDDFYRSRDAKKELDSSVEIYQRQFILMQGLIDRSEILHPIPYPFKISEQDLDTTTLVRFIYDDEPSLVEPGYVPFKEWIKQLNSTLEEGDRVVLSSGAPKTAWRLDSRFYPRINYKTYREETYNLPDPPSSGVYILHKRRGEGTKDPIHESHLKDPIDQLYIKYNPGDEVINMWDRYDRGHERKKQLSYTIDPKDEFVLNFDAVTVEKIDYYLNSRLDRRNYLFMMPLLWEMRERKIKEMDAEKEFVKMVIAPFISKHSEEKLTKEALELVKWWKLKNKWKRSLDMDNAKAFRMISGELKRKVATFVKC